MLRKHLTALVGTPLAVALSLAIGLAPSPTRAQGFDQSVQTKAAYIVNFTSFVTWPDAVMSDGNAPFVITVLGQDPFGEMLANLTAGRNVGGKRIEIQHVTTVSVDSLQRSHIVYISPSMADNVRWIITNTQHRPILTISEIPDFMSQGGVLNFVTENNRVAFEINVSAVERASLAVNARLLRLARQFRDQR